MILDFRSSIEECNGASDKNRRRANDHLRRRARLVGDRCAIGVRLATTHRRTVTVGARARRARDRRTIAVSGATGDRRASRRSTRQFGGSCECDRLAFGTAVGGDRARGLARAVHARLRELRRGAGEVGREALAVRRVARARACDSARGGGHAGGLARDARVVFGGVADRGGVDVRIAVVERIDGVEGGVERDEAGAGADVGRQFLAHGAQALAVGTDAGDGAVDVEIATLGDVLGPGGDVLELKRRAASDHVGGAGKLRVGRDLGDLGGKVGVGVVAGGLIRDDGAIERGDAVAVGRVRHGARGAVDVGLLSRQRDRRTKLLDARRRTIAEAFVLAVAEPGLATHVRLGAVESAGALNAIAHTVAHAHFPAVHARRERRVARRQLRVLLGRARRHRNRRAQMLHHQHHQCA